MPVKIQSIRLGEEETQAAFAKNAWVFGTSAPLDSFIGKKIVFFSKSENFFIFDPRTLDNPSKNLPNLDLIPH